MREAPELLCQGDGGVEFEPETVQAGVDFDMNFRGYSGVCGGPRNRLAQFE